MAIINDCSAEASCTFPTADDESRRIVYNLLAMDPESPHADPPSGNSPSRRRLLTGAKIAITVVGLYLALQSLNLNAILLTISDIDWGWMAVGAVLISVSLVVRAYRWQILLRGVGSSIRFSRLVELYLVGSFFNAFLPSGFGGDVVRAAEAAQDVDPSVAVGTVLVDRLTGLMALFVMALVALPFRPADFPDALAITTAGICLVGLALGLILVDGRLFRGMTKFLPGRIRSMGDGFIDRLAVTIHSCGWRALGGAILVSVLFNLIQVGWWTTTGRALHLEIPYTYYLLVVPFMSLALLVPSIGGLGVRENLAPVLFRGAGVLPEQAVAITLLVFGLERVASLLGAPVYIYSSIRNGRGQQASEKIVRHHQ